MPTEHQFALSDEEWLPMFSRRHMRNDEMNPDRLPAIWDGTINDEYGETAITGTIAITLKLMDRAQSMKDAASQAKAMWDSRTTNRFGAAA